MIYTNKFINLISFIISIIIFLFLNSFFQNIKIPKEKITNLSSFFEQKKELKEDTKMKENEEENILQTNNENTNWFIEIPSINLKAPIAEGTEKQTLNTKVGHFSETSIEDGNIGLAGHNRGYEKNYFENLKNTKMGDEIIYTHNNYKKTYIIDKIEIIENTNWNYLKKYEENKITLITCVENEPKYRRCIQATEK